mgnify:CR=1 FL=1
MDKQLRLNTIIQTIGEYKEKQEQAIYGANLSLRTLEFSHLKNCAEKLIHIEQMVLELSREARQLQDEIEIERLDVI